MENKELLAAIGKMMDDKLENALDPIKQDMSEMKQDIVSIRQDISGVEKRVAGIEQDITGVKQDIIGVKQDITGIKQEMTGMKEQIQAIDQRTTKIEIHLENTVGKTMQLLLEGQQGMNQKFRQLDDLTEKVEDIQTTVDVLKRLTAPA